MSLIATPQQAWERLLEGNERFVANTSSHPRQDAARRAELVSGQHPFAAILGCGDSRLAAEIIFDLGLGDAFVVRTAGQVLDDAVLGSLEYSASELEIPLIMVLGHDSCGAVTATRNSLISGTMPPGFIRNLVEGILPSVISPDLPDDATINEMVIEHTRQTAARIAEQSAIIREAVEGGTVAVIGVFYHLADGKAELVYSSSPNITD
ncbi:carbonic anhydrase [Rothia sp. (in: high G+C Gram-positive bacteria)]|uniref:carbonic anhydrase n=1 Tax=Rothia sp. (in: high G+C Gram-positive bacteria) TaxID=1885016 RepID=UPI000ED497E4|nr:carbonic anhydrase [Rothia sp. (in: high G+C Gram-positive bacteria)]